MVFNSLPPLPLVASGDEGPPVDHVGGLCPSLQLLKSQWIPAYENGSFELL